VGEYLHPPIEEGYNWRQVRVVHFTAVLTAITQGLLRTPNEELRASSAGVNKRQRASTVKSAFFGNNSRNDTSFLANETSSSFHLNSIILFVYFYFFFVFLIPLCIVYIYLFIFFSLTLLFSFFLWFYPSFFHSSLYYLPSWLTLFYIYIYIYIIYPFFPSLKNRCRAKISRSAIGRLASM
jgi:hypothetical protein